MAKVASLVTAVSQGEDSSVNRKNRFQDDEDLPFIIYAQASMLGSVELEEKPHWRNRFISPAMVHPCVHEQKYSALVQTCGASITSTFR